MYSPLWSIQRCIRVFNFSRGSKKNSYKGRERLSLSSFYGMTTFNQEIFCQNFHALSDSLEVLGDFHIATSFSKHIMMTSQIYIKHSVQSNRVWNTERCIVRENERERELLEKNNDITFVFELIHVLSSYSRTFDQMNWGWNHTGRVASNSGQLSSE